VELVADDGADSVNDWFAELLSLLCGDKPASAYTYTHAWTSINYIFDH